MTEISLAPVGGVGIKIEMPRTCRCGGPVAYIASDDLRLQCTSCDRPRGFLSKEIAEVLRWTTQTFGVLDRRYVWVRFKKQSSANRMQPANVIPFPHPEST
jgi:hypothetical protein